MLIDIIKKDAESRLLSLIEQIDQQGSTFGVLHFYCSKLAFKPNVEDVLLTVRPALDGRSAAIYFFQDGDIVFAWSGTQKIVVENICTRLYERYSPNADETLHKYYDLQAHGEDLRLLCKHKIEGAVKLASKLSESGAEPMQQSSLLECSPKQLQVFQKALYSRKYRNHPDILIVEDQLFSSKLLQSLLAHTYKTHAAANAMQGWNIYLEHAPDVVFLDIELPDISGHLLASTISKIDPEAFIVMVTGNNYLGDVTRAKKNGAKGFIVKPYNKQKIFDSIQLFQRRTKSA